MAGGVLEKGCFRRVDTLGSGILRERIFGKGAFLGRGQFKGEDMVGEGTFQVR